MVNHAISKYKIRRALGKIEKSAENWFSRQEVLDEIKFLIERLDSGMFDFAFAGSIPA